MNVDLDRFIASLAASTLLWSAVSLGVMLGLARAGAPLRRLGGLLLLAGFVMVAGLVGWNGRLPEEAKVPSPAPLVENLPPPMLAAAPPFVGRVDPPAAEVDLPPAPRAWRLPHDWRQSTRVLGLVWLCGVAGLMVVFLRESLRLSHIRRTGRRILQANKRPVFESAHCAGAFCTGLFRPCIILPRGLADRMDRQELAGLLAHEEAHIRLGDIRLAHFQAVVGALLWWNPLVWLLGRWLNCACEEVCDQAVIEGAALERRTYAECLVKAARYASAATWRLAPGASSDFSRLKKRVELILHTEAVPRPGWGRRLILGVPMILFAAWLGISAPSIGFGEEPAPHQAGDISALAAQAPLATPQPPNPTAPAIEATVPAPEAKVPALIPLVLLDPGHGGRDSGGMAAGVAEKDVVLNLAHRISALLSQSGLRVEMTRTEDIDLSLDSRLALVKKLQPSFLLSVHAEQSRLGRTPGLSVVEATNTGLGTAFATALATAANESVVAVATRGFRIVREPSCPALVFEAGDLANSQDVARLIDEGKREALAVAVAQAVRSIVQGGRISPRNVPEPNASRAVVHSEISHYPSPLEKIPGALADGFDFPVGAPDAKGYYRARVQNPNGGWHLGEDWNGKGGGNSDLGDPVYCVGHGVVVLSGEMATAWGNVIIVRHRYLAEDGSEQVCDSMYAHLLDRQVSAGAEVKRGQQIGRIGTGGGAYSSHLHFELRKNPAIGMNRSQFAKDGSNYWVPKDFIDSHRPAR